MAQREGRVNESLDLSDEKYEKPQIHTGDDGDGAKSKGGDGVGGGLPIAIAVPDDEDDDGFEDLERTPSMFMDAIERAQTKVSALYAKNQTAVHSFTILVLVLVFHAFLIAAIVHFTNGGEDQSSGIEWCDGLGFLIIITVVVYACLIYQHLGRPFLRKLLSSPKGSEISLSARDRYNKMKRHRFFAPLCYLLVFLTILFLLVVDTWHGDRRRLVSFFGLVVFVLVMFAISKHPGRIVWRHVFWGIGLQYLFGLLILRWEVGRAVFGCLGDKVSTFLAYTDAGSGFVFGYLVDQKPFNTQGLEPNSTAMQVAAAINDARAINFVFMFKILSVIYFFSFMVSMLFYLGAMQWVVIKIGFLLQITVGTTACESLNTAANIFLGQSEAPLLIKPFLKDMTKSEIHAVMTSGFATIAGSVLAAYISFQVSASHLLSASVMSAPAALACAKLVYPETKKSKTTASNLNVKDSAVSDEANLLDAASRGAVTAVFLCANIGGTLVAVLAFIAFINGVLLWCGSLVGIEDLTFEYVLGILFIPAAWLMGVETADLTKVGTLIGLKSFVNEFVAYGTLREMRAEGVADPLSERSVTIATYALCGFSNPASIGIQIAALGTMAPERKGDIARVAVRAFIAGSMACFLTACVAGSLIEV